MRSLAYHRIRIATMLLWVFPLLAGVTVLACSDDGGPPGNGASPASSAEETASPEARSWAGTNASPQFPGALSWFNVEKPVTLDDLRGKVVLLDFWTLGCINCQHIIPDLQRLEAEFGDALVVIGVHSGKYATEHDDESIREAIRRYAIEHPVANDPDFVFWQTFGAQAWPTLVLIDPAGNLVGKHAGEGVYPLFQPIVSSLVAEFDGRGLVDRTPLPVKPEASAADTLLAFPSKVLADEAGSRLFIADAGHNRIVVTDLDGIVKSVIGNAREGFADGSAEEAEFRQPQGLALSADGRTLFIADTRNHAVRAVDLASGEVTTVAGTGKQLDRLPISGAKGRDTALGSPWDVVAVGETLYISMAGVHQLWALDLISNEISVFAGTSREGIDDGPRQAATLAQPSGIASDGDVLYWVDPESSSLRRVGIAGNGEVESLIGTGLFDYGNDDGLQSKLQHAQGVALAHGNVFIADTYNHRIRALDLKSAETSTIAGDERGYADGSGTDAEFDEPGGLSAASGRLYVADTNNNAIRVVDLASAQVSTLLITGLLAASSDGRGLPVVTLESVEVAAGSGVVEVSIIAPPGHHLNSQAPGSLDLIAADGSVVRLSESSLRWSSDGDRFSATLPADFAPGTTTLTGSLAAYYCRSGEEALCFIQRATISLSVAVVEAGGAGVLAFVYTLPASG